MKTIKAECGMRKDECGEAARLRRSPSASPLPHSAFTLQHSAFPLPHSASPLPHFPRGLTLIELLVTIAILVTVLGGVVPMMSPNNDARKIREASRQLNGMLAQAQAQAARDGRAVGVAFREFGRAPGPYSGMALEAFFIAEPKPFAGFSPNSRAKVNLNLGGQAGSPSASPPTAWYASDIEFTVIDASGEQPDPLPPNTIRKGDIVEVGGIRYRIVDGDQDGNPGEEPDFEDGDFYTSTNKSVFQCRWINWSDSSSELARTAPMVNVIPTGSGGVSYGKYYRIDRQPRNTSDAPLQFPTGIGIDMDVSGAEGQGGVPRSFDSGGTNTVGIMFAPNGTLYALYYDGKVYTGVDRVYLHVGRFENGNNGSMTREEREGLYDFSVPVSNDVLEQRREQFNWLNPDSRWVSVNRAGRIITAQNQLFDPRGTDFVGENRDRAPEEQYTAQRNKARELARDMTSEGGR